MGQACTSNVKVVASTIWMSDGPASLSAISEHAAGSNQQNLPIVVLPLRIVDELTPWTTDYVQQLVAEQLTECMDEAGLS
jgi:hypothetical protein